MRTLFQREAEAASQGGTKKVKGFTDAGQPVRDSIGRGSVDTKRAVLQDRILKEQMLQKQLQLLESNSSNHVHKIEREEGEIVTERVEGNLIQPFLCKLRIFSCCLFTRFFFAKIIT